MVELQAINQKGNCQQNSGKNSNNPFLIILLMNSQWQLNHVTRHHLTIGYWSKERKKQLLGIREEKSSC